MKKVLSVLLVLALVFTLAISASAAGASGEVSSSAADDIKDFFNELAITVGFDELKVAWKEVVAAFEREFAGILTWVNHFFAFFSFIH